MLSPCKRPDPIWRNPSSQDEPYGKPLRGPIIGLYVHVVIVALMDTPGALMATKPVRDPAHESGANKGAQPFTRRGPQVQHRPDAVLLLSQ